ncbi:hypothetical protein Avbf_18279 [Armadillidium vulgare]|nr:hypothetical protein Avbf_18279 [Armadillidium vulgare]
MGGRRRIRVPSLLRSQGQAIQGTRDADVKTPSSEKDSSGLCAEKNSSAGSGEEARGNGEEARRPDEDRNGGGPEEGRVSRGSEALEKELESLKEKIRLMEKEGVEASKFLCLVCQRTYDRPARRKRSVLSAPPCSTQTTSGSFICDAKIRVVEDECEFCKRSIKHWKYELLDIFPFVKTIKQEEEEEEDK